MAILAITLGAFTAFGYPYTWVGLVDNDWGDEGNWERPGCSTDCGYPDDTSDDATITDSLAIVFPATSPEIDDLTIADADVRLGPTGSGYCSSFAALTADSIVISASSGQTAKLRGGHCVTVETE